MFFANFSAQYLNNINKKHINVIKIEFNKVFFEYIKQIKIMSEKVLVPDIGEFENVEVIEILVKSGDQIKKNDPLITIESDKSSVEIPSTVDGKIESIGLKVGDKVSKGDLILNYLSSTITTNTDTIPKDTENIIKQAEEVIAVQTDKELSLIHI